MAKTSSRAIETSGEFSVIVPVRGPTSPDFDHCRLARLAHHDHRTMDDGIGELREEMIARFERIDRRLDESLAAITQQVVERRADTDFACERLDRADQSLSAGIARLERKLDRILALAAESRARFR